MTDKKPEYLLFDLGGQQVAVTDIEIDEKGLRSTWVVLGEQTLSDEMINEYLNKAFRDLLADMPDADEPEPEPVVAPKPEQKPEQTIPWWNKVCKKIKELL